MKLIKIGGSLQMLLPLVTTLALITSGCANRIDPALLGGSGGLTNGPTLQAVSGNNVLPLTVNGSLCDATNSQGYLNKPCVSITICSTTNGNCQTINDVLVDTGSYGLRVFKSVLNSNLNLQPVMSGTSTVGDCQQYGGLTADWGTVSTANVILGSEPAVTVPIEVIDPNFAQSSVCTSDGAGDTFTLDTDPASTGYNAILGVGLFAADCGPDCASDSSNGQYFACTSTTCTGITMAESSQVTNPVALEQTDNNGVIVQLPSLGLGGAQSLNGYLVLGIGTQSNNTPASPKDLSATAPADEFGTITTAFNGTSVSGFIDSGSNSYYFDKPTSLPDCTEQYYTGDYCPSSDVNFSATNTASSGGTSVGVPFYVGNAYNFNQNNSVFIEYGADDQGQGMFDWGLPFFIGRNVYVGLDGTSSPLGTGPYWAF